MRHTSFYVLPFFAAEIFAISPWKVYYDIKQSPFSPGKEEFAL